MSEPVFEAAEQGVGRGAVVVVQDAGVDDHIKDVCERFAAEGYRAIAPQRLETGLDHLREDGFTDDRIAVVGFGPGASAALTAAGRCQLGAAVTFSGGGELQELAPRLQTPWIGFFGAAEEVEALRAAAAQASVATEVARDGRDAWERTLAWLDEQLA